MRTKQKIGIIIFLGILLMLVFSGCQKTKAVNLIEKPTQVEESVVTSVVLPSEVHLEAPLVNQMDYPVLYNGCEVTSLAMLLNYYGVPVTKNELAEKIDKVPFIDEEGFHGNPSEGFVGDVVGYSEGLGVFHQPIAKLLKTYVPTERVQDISGESFQKVLEAMAQGNPVWVITTTNYEKPEELLAVETRSGVVEITYSIHSVLLVGYDEEYLYLNDPYGYENVAVSKTTFEESWAAMGSQAVYYADNHEQ